MPQEERKRAYRAFKKIYPETSYLEEEFTRNLDKPENVDWLHGEFSKSFDEVPALEEFRKSFADPIEAGEEPAGPTTADMSPFQPKQKPESTLKRELSERATIAQKETLDVDVMSPFAMFPKREAIATEEREKKAAEKLERETKQRQLSQATVQYNEREKLELELDPVIGEITSLSALTETNDKLMQYLRAVKDYNDNQSKEAYQDVQNLAKDDLVQAGLKDLRQLQSLYKKNKDKIEYQETLNRQLSEVPGDVYLGAMYSGEEGKKRLDTIKGKIEKKLTERKGKSEDVYPSDVLSPFTAHDPEREKLEAAMKSIERARSSDESFARTKDILRNVKEIIPWFGDIYSMADDMLLVQAREKQAQGRDLTDAERVSLETDMATTGKAISTDITKSKAITFGEFMDASFSGALQSAPWLAEMATVQGVASPIAKTVYSFGRQFVGRGLARLGAATVGQAAASTLNLPAIAKRTSELAVQNPELLEDPEKLVLGGWLYNASEYVSEVGGVPVGKAFGSIRKNFFNQLVAKVAEKKATKSAFVNALSNFRKATHFGSFSEELYEEELNEIMRNSIQFAVEGKDFEYKLPFTDDEATRRLIEEAGAIGLQQFGFAAPSIPGRAKAFIKTGREQYREEQKGKKIEKPEIPESEIKEETQAQPTPTSPTPTEEEGGQASAKVEKEGIGLTEPVPSVPEKERVIAPNGDEATVVGKSETSVTLQFDDGSIEQHPIEDVKPIEEIERKPVEAPKPETAPTMGKTPIPDETKPETSEKKLSSTQVNVPEGERKPFVDFAQSIPSDEIYKPETSGQPGGYGIEVEPHVTALFGLKTMNPKEVQETVKDYGNIKLRLGKMSIFKNKEFDVLKIDVESDDLNAVNKKLRENHEYENDHSDYQPHLTIAYLKPGEGEKYIGDDRFTGKTFTINELIFSDADRNQSTISLSKPSEPQTKKELWHMTQEEFIRSSPLPEKGKFIEGQTMPNTGEMISAVKLDNGDIYYDTSARQHSDVIDNLNIPAERVVESGFVTHGKYSKMGAKAVELGRQARLQKVIQHDEAVHKAFQEGKPIPEEVLKDYPELQGKNEPSYIPDVEVVEEKPVIPEEKIPARPLVNPKASALTRDKQLRAQQKWDKQYGKETPSKQYPDVTPASALSDLKQVNPMLDAIHERLQKLNGQGIEAFADNNTIWMPQGIWNIVKTGKGISITKEQSLSMTGFNRILDDAKGTFGEYMAYNKKAKEYSDQRDIEIKQREEEEEKRAREAEEKAAKEKAEKERIDKEEEKKRVTVVVNRKDQNTSGMAKKYDTSNDFKGMTKLGGRTETPVLQYVNVKNGIMYATNGQTIIETPTDQKDGLYQFVGKGLKAVKADETDPFPQSPKKEKPIVQLTANIATEIKRALTFVSTDEPRPAMTGVYFEFKDKTIKMVATDGHRLSVSTIQTDKAMPGVKFVVPIEVLNSIKTKNDIELAFGKNQIRVSDGTITATSPYIEEQYPNYEAVIPIEAQREYLFNREQLLNAVKTVLPYANNTTHQVRFHVKENKISVEAEDVDAGRENKIEVDMRQIDGGNINTDNLTIAMPMRMSDGVGKANDFAINGDHVVEALNNIAGDVVYVGQNKPTQAHIFYGKDPIVREKEQRAKVNKLETDVAAVKTEEKAPEDNPQYLDIHKANIPKRATLPILENGASIGGKLISTDLAVSLETPTTLPEGVYNFVGKDFVKTPEDTKDFPSILKIGEVKANAIINFTPEIIQTKEFVSDDELRPTMVDVIVDVRDGKVTAYGTDGIVSTRRTVQAKDVEGTGTFQVSPKAMNLIAKMPGQWNAEFGADGVRLTNGEVVLTNRYSELPQNDLPQQMDALFPKKVSKVVEVNKKDFNKTLPAIKDIAKQNGASEVYIVFSGNENNPSIQVIKSENGKKEYENIGDPIPIKATIHSGGDVTTANSQSLVMGLRNQNYAFTLKYLTRVMKGVPGESLFIGQKDDPANKYVYTVSGTNPTVETSGAELQRMSTVDDSQQSLNQTDTPQFKKWFSDSKVVDDEGSPLVVYHAAITGRRFNVFDISKEGAHFGTMEQASNLSGYKRGKPKAFYLSIKNPVRMQDIGVWNNFNNLHANLVRADIVTQKEGNEIWNNWQKTDDAGWKSIKDVLARKGYDGIVYENEQEGEGDSYIAFFPNQIKSAIGNKGTFDPHSKDMMLMRVPKGQKPSEIIGAGKATGPQVYGVEEKEANEILQKAIPGLIERGIDTKNIKIETHPEGWRNEKEVSLTDELANSYTKSKVVWFSGMRLNGFYDPITNKVFINTQATNPVRQVFYHEFKHYIDHHPKYKHLLDAPRKVFLEEAKQPEILEHYREKYGKEAFDEALKNAEKEGTQGILGEAFADAMAERMMDVDFWKKLHAKSPSVIRELIAKIQEFIRSLLGKGGYQMDRFLRNAARFYSELDTALEKITELASKEEISDISAMATKKGKGAIPSEAKSPQPEGRKDKYSDKKKIIARPIENVGLKYGDPLPENVYLHGSKEVSGDIENFSITTTPKGALYLTKKWETADIFAHGGETGDNIKVIELKPKENIVDLAKPSDRMKIAKLLYKESGTDDSLQKFADDLEKIDFHTTGLSDEPAYGEILYNKNIGAIKDNFGNVDVINDFAIKTYNPSPKPSSAPEGGAQTLPTEPPAFMPKEFPLFQRMPAEEDLFRDIVNKNVNKDFSDAEKRNLIDEAIKSPDKYSINGVYYKQERDEKGEPVKDDEGKIIYSTTNKRPTKAEYESGAAKNSLNPETDIAPEEKDSTQKGLNVVNLQIGNRTQQIVIKTPELKKESEPAEAPPPEKVIGLNKKEQDAIRELTGLDKLPKAERSKWVDVLARAKSNKLDESALEIADLALAKDSKRMITDEEHAGMVIKTAKLVKEYNESVETISKLISSGDVGAASVERARAQLIIDQIDKLTNGARSARREVARALAIGRMFVNAETYDIAHVVQRAVAAKGTKLTEKENAAFEKLAADYKALEEKLRIAEKNYTKAIEERDRALARRTFDKEAVKRERNLIKIRQERTDIKNKLAALGLRVNDITGLAPEASYLVGRLAITYIKEGAVTLEDLTNKIMTDVPDLTTQDVYRALNTQDPKAKERAESETRKQINRLKTQARLILEVEDAEKGIFKPKKKASDTLPAIKELKKTLTRLRSIAYRTGSERLEEQIRKINELQDQLVNHYRLVKQAKEILPESEDIKVLKEKISNLKKIMRAEDEIASLDEQLRTGEFIEKERPLVRVIDPRLERAQVELNIKRKQIKRAIEDLKPYTAGKIVGEIVNTLRTLKATADISTTLRQGAFLSARRPVKAIKILGQSLNAFFSEFKAEQIDNAIRQSNLQYLRDKSGLFLAELESTPNAREEYFMARFIEKFYGIGHLIKASNRSMVTTLNLLRVAAFDGFVDTHPNATNEELKAWADYVTCASGRGSLGKFSQAGSVLSYVIFAPRFAVSRIFTPYKLIQHWKNPRVRKEMAKDYAAFFGLGLTTLTLASLAGATVGGDPDDPDWGKIVIGKTRIDIWAGFQQPARVVARFMMYASDKTGITDRYTPKEEDKIGLLDIIERFAEFKFAPAVTIPLEFAEHKTIVGEKTTPIGTAANIVTPMVIDDIIDAAKYEGFGAAVGVGALATLGVSVATYGEEKTFKDNVKKVNKKIEEIKHEGAKGEEGKKRAIEMLRDYRPLLNLKPDANEAKNMLEFLKEREEKTEKESEKEKIEKWREEVWIGFNRKHKRAVDMIK